MNPRHKVFAQELQEKLKQIDVVLSLETCYQAWRDYSEDSCAGWIYHKDLEPQDILGRMTPYLTKENR